MIKNILKGIRKNAMLIHTYIRLYSQKWKEVQLFSNCTSNHRKEGEGLSLCSSLVRGAFLC